MQQDATSLTAAAVAAQPAADSYSMSVANVLFTQSQQRIRCNRLTGTDLLNTPTGKRRDIWNPT